jgi:hypothetical protein
MTFEGFRAFVGELAGVFRTGKAFDVKALDVV